MARGTPKTLNASPDPYGSRVLLALAAKLGTDAYMRDVSEIAMKIGDLDYAGQLAVLDLCQRALRDERSSQNEPARVACTKVLVALAPLSAEAIESWFERPAQVSGEIQFSILCSLDRLPDIHSAADFVERVPEMLERFLMKVEEDPAQAAWMAADLLGDHWPLARGLPVLQRVAAEAPHRTAREAAVHGLAHALQKADVRTRWSVVETLKDILLRDRDPVVQERARATLDAAPM